MRVSRANTVIGEWSFSEVKQRIATGELMPTDTYYDEDASDWLLISELLAKRAAQKDDKGIVRPCYCGSNLPFRDCCGDGSKY